VKGYPKVGLTQICSSVQYLLGTNLFLSPSGKTSVTLDSEAIASVATTKATNSRAQATERALLGCLSGHGLVEGPLGENRKTHSARVLSAGIEVGRGEEAANSGRTGAVTV
jgi:hypothetical protein